MEIVADGSVLSLDLEAFEMECAASFEDQDCRERAAEEDLFCFVTYLGAFEGVLGLGIHVHPMSKRQRQLVPELDLVLDYIDVAAYNRGISVTNAALTKRERTFMVSSTRRKLNGWLPLYINADHWSEARRYAPSAFAQLGADAQGHTFHPPDALNVCSRLLTCTAVGFTVGQGENAKPHEASRGKASDKSMQMYADVHRLLLQMVKEHPVLTEIASARLRDFMGHPANRTRQSKPSLGHLMQCLLIVEDISWHDLSPTLVPEALRRHVARQRLEGRVFDSRTCGTMEELIAAWDDFAPQAGTVLSFSAIFLQRVGRPDGLSLNDVTLACDQRWGRLRDDVRETLIRHCADLSRKTSLTEVMVHLLPEQHRTRETICELILWAEKFGRHVNSGAIPAHQWPHLGSSPLLSRWQHRHTVAPCKHLSRRASPSDRRRWKWQPKVVPLPASDQEDGGQDGVGTVQALTTDVQVWDQEFDPHWYPTAVNSFVAEETYWFYMFSWQQTGFFFPA